MSIAKHINVTVASSRPTKLQTTVTSLYYLSCSLMASSHFSHRGRDDHGSADVDEYQYMFGCEARMNSAQHELLMYDL